MSDNQTKVNNSYWSVKIIIAVALILTIFLGYQVYIKNKPELALIHEAKQLASNSKALQSVLGSPIKAELLISSLKFNKTFEQSEMMFNFRVSGPYGYALIDAKATKTANDVWQVDRELTDNALTKDGKRYSVLVAGVMKSRFKNYVPNEVEELPIYPSPSVIGQYFYLISDFMSADKDKIKWLQRAVDFGSPEAANNLAIFYEKGKGIKKDHVTAMRLYEQSAQGGDYAAMYNLGLKARESADYANAIKWYEAALHVYPNACSFYDLAILNAKGQGIKADPNKAKSLFQDAATDLLTAGRFYRKLAYKMGSERINFNEDDAITAFVESQYEYFAQNKTMDLTSKYNSEVIDITKELADELKTRCWD